MDTRPFSTPAGELTIRESSGAEPALVCLHGFTLHGEMFRTLAVQSWRRIVAPDLPGHGATSIEPVDLPTTLDGLATWLRELPGPQVLLGYSMGGRVALHMAARHPELVRHVIAVSTSLGIVDSIARSRRREADEQLASHVLEVGVAAFLDEWSRHPLVGAGQLDAAAAAADRSLRTQKTAAGLAAALRGLGQGVVPPLSPAGLHRPVTWVAGELDDRYRTIALAAAAQLGSTAAVVPGAGHNVIRDAPDAIVAIVDDVVSRLS